jgi:hypothetical protein
MNFLFKEFKHIHIFHNNLNEKMFEKKSKCKLMGNVFAIFRFAFDMQYFKRYKFWYFSKQERIYFRNNIKQHVDLDLNQLCTKNSYFFTLYF